MFYCTVGASDLNVWMHSLQFSSLSEIYTTQVYKLAFYTNQMNLCALLSNLGHNQIFVFCVEDEFILAECYILSLV